MKIGFIGQGYVGKNMADDFAMRSYDIVRYSLDPAYIENKNAILTCDVVFIAVPTPSTPQGFDYSIVKDAISLVRPGACVVIKSTLIPGTTELLQKEYPDRTVLFSPEFLLEVSAAEDSAHPIFNIIGMTEDTDIQKKVAEEVMALLPLSKNQFYTTATAAEIFKYAHNIQGYMRVILSNLLYDVSSALATDWEQIKQMMQVDPMMSPWYNSPIHKTGRGAGGHCFIKDMAAFRMLYAHVCAQDAEGLAVLTSMEKKNRELLRTTNKDQDLVEGVYGKQ
jgi:UDPglucose 6-dehydrogenase